MCADSACSQKTGTVKNSMKEYEKELLSTDYADLRRLLKEKNRKEFSHKGAKSTKNKKDLTTTKGTNRHEGRFALRYTLPLKLLFSCLFQRKSNSAKSLWNNAC